MNTFLDGRADRQHVQALLMCKQVPALELLFTKLLNETQTAMLDADDTVHIHRLQGRAKVLKDFLEAVNTAPSVLERLK
jgi:hypothetical protein